jgi:hypothetical protein
MNNDDNDNDFTNDDIHGCRMCDLWLLHDTI